MYYALIRSTFRLKIEKLSIMEVCVILNFCQIAINFITEDLRSPLQSLFLQGSLYKELEKYLMSYLRSEYYSTELVNEIIVDLCNIAFPSFKNQNRNNFSHRIISSYNSINSLVITFTALISHSILIYLIIDVALDIQINILHKFGLLLSSHPANSTIEFNKHVITPILSNLIQSNVLIKCEIIRLIIQYLSLIPDQDLLMNQFISTFKVYLSIKNRI